MTTDDDFDTDLALSLFTKDNVFQLLIEYCKLWFSLHYPGTNYLTPKEVEQTKRSLDDAFFLFCAIKEVFDDLPEDARELVMNSPIPVLGDDYKCSAGNTSIQIVSRERTLLRSDIERYCHHNIDIVEFAVNVWGVDQNQAQRIMSKAWQLDKQWLGVYSRARREGELHEPFRKLTSDLLKRAARELKCSSTQFVEGIWDQKGNKSLEECQLGKRPDMLKFFGILPKSQTWATVLTVYEFKRSKSLLEAILEEDENPKATRSAPDTHAASSKSTGDSKSRPRAPKAQPSRSARIASLPVHLDGAPKQELKSLKRPSESEESEPESKPESKRRRLMESDLQTASYALECLGSTSRYFTVCLVIFNFEITVLYFDRILALRVARFNFKDEPAKLALALYGLNTCDRRQAGFDPHLRAWPASFPPNPKLLEAIEQPVAKLEGSYFEIEGFSGQDDSEKAIHCFRVYSVISQPRDLIGRATAVYQVKKAFANKKYSRDHYVLKVSWPLRTRPSEVEFVRHLRSALPSALHVHLPTLEFYATFTAQELDLPWTRLDLGFTDDNYHERVLRAFCSRFCKPLWEADSVEEFKQIWLDCLECHHAAWKQGKVLHRDLSENNLMFYRDPNGDVKGVLNDWDMASYIDENGLTIRSGAHHRTGTLPFMATDLLTSEGGQEHYFRHELESFVYLLVWAALHYDLQNREREDPKPKVADWNGPTNDISASVKNNFFSMPNYAEDVYKQARPEWADVIREWVEPLRDLFDDARYAARKVKKPEDKAKYDYATYNGILTFETFTTKIGVTPRDWEKLSL
ncbi:hypothetical protein H1R20_g16399, partial [Candolleomyces eurysporus]